MSKSSSTSGKVSDGGPTAELEQLRVDARSRGVEWLLTAVSALKRDEVRKLAQAAGLPARGAGGGWLPVAELREAPRTRSLFLCLCVCTLLFTCRKPQLDI